MKWVMLFLVLLLCTAGVAAWMLRERVEALCHSSRSLARRAPLVSAWLAEAAAEPFLGESALDGPPSAVIAALRARARVIPSEFSARLVPEPAIKALQNFALAADRPALLKALEELPAAVKSFECRKNESRPEDTDLDQDFGAAESYWKSRKDRLPADKAAFAADRLIFCKGEELLARLRGLAAVAERKCHDAKTGTKLAKSCSSGGAISALDAEIQDVQRKRDMNERKLRQKWPTRVVEGLRC